MKLTTIVFAVAAAAVSITTLFSAPVSAEELFGSQQIVQFTNDRDSGLSLVELLTTAQGVADGLRYTSSGASTRGARLEFTLAQLNAGAVLESQQGVNALVLKGPIDAKQGGTLTFTYVANGMTGSYESCQAELRHNPDGGWVLYNKSTRAPIKSAKIVTWSMGITTLEGICPNK